MSRGLDQPEVMALRLAWSWANSAQAALNAYRHTGEERFLDLMVPHFDEIMAKRDVVTGRLDETLGRPSKAWSSKVGDSTKWKAVLTHAGRLTAPMAEFVLLVNTRPALARYRVQAARLLPAIEAAVAEFDSDYRVIARRSAGYYVRREFGDVEPLNHMHAFGETLVLLYRITGKDKYRARVAELGRYFAASMFEQPNGTRVWGYQPTPENLTQHKPEPVWKAQVTIRFPLQGYLNGVVFTQDDARNLAAVFTRNVHRGGGSFATSIAQKAGHTFDKGSKRQVALGRTLALWIYLDQVDPAVRELIEQTVASDPSLFPGGWLQDYVMAEAYSHRLAPRAGPRR
jgi:hypothetical protein